MAHYKLLNQTAKSPGDYTTTASSALCWNLTNLEEYSLYAMKVKAITVKEGNFSEMPVQCMTWEGRKWHTQILNLLIPSLYGYLNN